MNVGRREREGGRIAMPGIPVELDAECRRRGG